MKKSTARTIKVGIFITLILAAFFFSVYYIGKNQNLFQQVTKIYTVFDDIKGLNKGSRIRFSGINVGTVSEIEIIKDTTIMVEMAIQTEYVKFIKEDSKVEITTEGLMGTKILEIHHGSEDAPSVEEEAILQARETINVEEILEEATGIVQDSKAAAENLLRITTQVIEGKGSLGRLLYDTTLVHDVDYMLNNLRQSSKNATEITEHISQGKGDLGKLIYDNKLTTNLNQTFETLEKASQEVYRLADNLAEASRQINEGDGLANTLIYDTTMMETADSTLHKINQSIDEITETANAIENAWIINLFSKNKDKKKKKERSKSD